jgi:hypothetical protein
MLLCTLAFAALLPDAFCERLPIRAYGTADGLPSNGVNAIPPRLQNRQAHLYSDLLIHHMGSALANDITQGLAQGDMFRTTSLCGGGQRIFFLHFNALSPADKQAILNFLRSL